MTVSSSAMPPLSAPPSPTTYTMRCPWSVPIPNSRPARVVASPEQLVVLKALYARTGDDATKKDVEDVSRETGLEEKWIRKWIKRQRSPRRKGKRFAASGVPPVPAPDKNALESDIVGSAMTPGPTADHNTLSPPAFDLYPVGPAWRSPLQAVTSKSGSGSGSTASPGDSPSFSERPWSGLSNAAVRDASSMHTSPITPAQTAASTGPSLTYIPPLAPAIQVAQPGASFVVPLRPDPDSRQGSNELSSLLPSGLSGVDTGSPALGYGGLDFSAPHPINALSPSQATLWNGSSSYLPSHSGLNIPTDGPPLDPLQMPLELPSSAPPSAFSMPGRAAPAGLTASAAYLYRLLDESNGAGASEGVEPLPFHTTSFLGELAPSPDVYPDLWTGVPGLVPLPGPAEIAGFGLPPTPVSYQMTMSELVVLTNAVRAAAAEATPGPDAHATSGKQRADGYAVCPALRHPSPSPDVADPAMHLDAVGEPSEPAATPVMVPDSVNFGLLIEEEETEDEVEVVTPCEEVESFVAPDVSMGDSAKDKEVYRAEVAIADSTAEDTL